MFEREPRSSRVEINSAHLSNECRFILMQEDKSICVTFVAENLTSLMGAYYLRDPGRLFIFTPVILIIPSGTLDNHLEIQHIAFK